MKYNNTNVKTEYYYITYVRVLIVEAFTGPCGGVPSVEVTRF